MLAEYGIGVGVAGGSQSGAPELASWFDAGSANLALIVVVAIGSLYLLLSR